MQCTSTSSFCHLPKVFFIYWPKVATCWIWEPRCSIQMFGCRSVWQIWDLNDEADRRETGTKWVFYCSSSWSLDLIAPIVTNKGAKKEGKWEKAEFMLFIVWVFLRQLLRSVGNGAHYLKWRHQHSSAHSLQVTSSQIKILGEVLINNWYVVSL